MTTPIRGAAALAAAVAVSFILASCGGDATTGNTPAADQPTTAEQVEGSHNEADVMFAQGMLPHHRQAVQMAELAPDRTDTPEVLALAEEIAAAQQPEIQTLTAFLEAWGAEVPAEDMPMEMDGMDHGGSSGMMNPEQMADLQAAEGGDFDQMFLQLMTAHHQGAVEMAQTELDDGENQAALTLAQTIIDTQESEIDRMQDLLSEQ